MLARQCTYAHPHYCIRPLLIWGENMGANAAILYIFMLATTTKIIWEPLVVVVVVVEVVETLLGEYWSH